MVLPLFKTFQKMVLQITLIFFMLAVCISGNNTTVSFTNTTMTVFNTTSASIDMASSTYMTKATTTFTPLFSVGQCKARVDKCEPLQYTKCLGLTLPYSHTSLVFANDSHNQTEAQEKLQLWSGLQSVPRCWAVIQPLLCAIYMPQCNDSQVDLVSKELCEKTREPCQIVDRTEGWPDFLRCEVDSFQSKCNSPLESAEFNTSSKCAPPLISTPNKNSWYIVDGCGLPCKNPLFTDDQHDQVHIFVAVCGAICLVCTLFTLLTFIIDWKYANKFPALILFFINACFFIGSIGWLAQFSPGARDDIVCASDGTMRKGEPLIGSGESASCTFVFIFVYFSMMAGVTWFVILAYAWHLTFKALGTPQDAIEGKVAYFHIVAWCLPLVLTIVCLALTEIDGDSVSGICFVGYINHWARGVFVLLPTGLAIMVGLVFLCMGLATLIKLKKESPGVISDKATAKIRETIFRIGLFALLALCFALITLGVHLYIFTKEAEWREAYEEYIICQATASLGVEKTICTLESTPSLPAMQIHIFAYFGAGIAMSSWVWTKTTLDAWKRFFRKLFRIPDNKPVKLKKHKMIAQAFAKRQALAAGGNMSITFCSTHDDPLGMKFDLNSVTSADMSSAWVAAVPNLVRRRGGMIHPTAGTLRRYSDSDIQSMASLASVRKHSIDSQISRHDIEEMKSKKKKKRGRKGNRIAPMMMATGLSSRRGSNGHRGSDGRRGSDGIRGSAVHRGGDTRRASEGSIITNASAKSVNFSMEKLTHSMEKLASSIESLHKMALGSKDNTRPGTGIQNLNAMNTFALFTASSFKPIGTVELIDLDNVEQTDNERTPTLHRRHQSRSMTYPTEAVVQIQQEEDDGDSSDALV